MVFFNFGHFLPNIVSTRLICTLVDLYASIFNNSFNKSIFLQHESSEFYFNFILIIFHDWKSSHTHHHHGALEYIRDKMFYRIGSRRNRKTRELSCCRWDGHLASKDAKKRYSVTFLDFYSFSILQGEILFKITYFTCNTRL